MVVLRLTVHGAKQPQNSPHGWDRKTGTHECFDADYAYGCWAIVTPPWTEGDYLEGFSQNTKPEDLPECCDSSTVRCYFPEDFLNCYPWPAELGIFETTLHKIKCRERNDNQQEGEDLCVVVGDNGGVYVTGSGFSPMSEKGGDDKGLDTVFARY